MICLEIVIINCYLLAFIAIPVQIITLVQIYNEEFTKLRQNKPHTYNTLFWSFTILIPLDILLIVIMIFFLVNQLIIKRVRQDIVERRAKLEKANRLRRQQLQTDIDNVGYCAICFEDFKTVIIALFGLNLFKLSALQIDAILRQTFRMINKFDENQTGLRMINLGAIQNFLWPTNLLTIAERQKLCQIKHLFHLADFS